MITLFWLSLVAIAYPYAIYPVLLVVTNRLLGRESRSHDFTHLPMVTLILPVHNERERLGAKIENLLSLDYPRERVQLLVVGDGCTDDSLENASRIAGGRVTISNLPRRAGKAAALNAGVERAAGEILVFTDVGIMLATGALRALVGHFGDPEVGCVSGEDHVEEGGGEGLYGRLELLLRREEAKLHSIAGASGCFYAVRRSIWRPFASGMAPDFLSVLDTVRAGSRAICEPLAHGTMSATSSLRAEFSRKSRTFLRGLTALLGNTDLLNPLRYPAFAFILLSHKLLRWLGPAMLAACLASAFAMRHEPLYLSLLMIQLVFYGLGLAALVTPQIAGRLALPRLAGYFLLANAAAAKACASWLIGVRQELWEPTRRPQ